MNMEQTDIYGAVDEMQQVKPIERSKLAVASLVCALIFCCPIVTIFGPILGVIALLKMKSKPQLGKGLAIAGVLLGALTTALSIIAIVIAISFGIEFMNTITKSATDVILASYSQDYEAARHHMLGHPLTVSDEEISAFGSELQTRYGVFDSVVVDWGAQDQKLHPVGQQSPMPVILIFETESVNATFMFEIVPGGDFVESKFCCIKIHDTKNGDIIFPKDSACAQ